MANWLKNHANSFPDFNIFLPLKLQIVPSGEFWKETVVALKTTVPAQGLIRRESFWQCMISSACGICYARRSLTVSGCYAHIIDHW